MIFETRVFSLGNEEEEEDEADGEDWLKKKEAYAWQWARMGHWMMMMMKEEDFTENFT